MTNEKRLIDANALMEQVKAIHKAVDTSAINTDYDTGFHSATSQVQGLIAYMQTVDAVEVVHGRWVAVEFGAFYKCSNCGHLVSMELSRYCPNCGAKMDVGAGNAKKLILRRRRKEKKC